MEDNLEFSAEDVYEMFLNNSFNFMNQTEIQFMLSCLNYFKDNIVIAESTNLVDSVEVVIKITRDMGGNKKLESLDPVIEPSLQDE